MKYIKRYNEELDPSTYRRAASSLRYYNKDKRADVLSDYADDKEFGFYKFNMGSYNSDGTVNVLAKDYVFTNPALIGIYYGNINNSGLQYPDNIIRKQDTDDDAAKLVSEWANGQQNLNVTFEFGFKATKETINFNDKNRATVNSDLLRHPASKSRRWDLYGERVPMFSIQLSLCSWEDGIEGWDEEAKWQAELDGEEFTPSKVYDIYEYEKQEYFSLERPNIPTISTCGIFADRKSAFKFMKLLPTLINENAKDKVMDVLRVIGADGEDLSRALKSFDTIRLHGLYDDDCSTSMKRQWHRKIN
jgi:hypothetical protein